MKKFIYNFEEDVFDIGYGEAFMANTPGIKLDRDMSKLLREGKLMQTTVQNVVNNDSCVFSWILQIFGKTCCFYTVHATKYQYHVCYPQFTATFPSEYSALSSFFETRKYLHVSR
ncbi:hypothetical protein HPULCUR_003846 [Helicostylum pulchrum]|uniref:Uncharacterized protein n=1 Tax=Helicostylum pulchrum TaxID=562976 RepID=A0ABP9XW20_9FUNG